MDKQERELLDLGFKRKWLSDKSAYWFEYKLKNRTSRIMFVVDLEFNQYELQTDSYYENKTIKKYSSLESLLETIKTKNIW